MPSTEHSRTEFLKTQYGRLAALKFAPSEPDAIRAIKDSWARILDDVGEERFAKGISKCLEIYEEWPSILKFKEQIPPEDGVRCAACRDREGWLMVSKPHPWKDGQTYEVATRCKHGL